MMMNAFFITVLRSIERANMSSFGKYSTEWASLIQHSCKQLELSNFATLLSHPPKSYQTLFEARKCDHISHYLLRLAFCK